MVRPLTTARSSESDVELAATLPRRVVFTMLRGAMRIAARLGMPLSDLLELTRLAYLQEQQRRIPRSLAGISRALNLSVRQVSNLKKQLGTVFTEPDETIAPYRAIGAELMKRPQLESELCSTLSQFDPHTLRSATRAMRKLHWLSENEQGFLQLKPGLRVHTSETTERRLDGLAQQLELLADGAWTAFTGRDDLYARGRSWVFRACPTALRQIGEETLQNLRHQIADLEHEAERQRGGSLCGITVMVSDLRAAYAVDEKTKDLK